MNGANPMFTPRYTYETKYPQANSTKIRSAFDME